MTHPIITAIEERRTVNLFDPTRSISEGQINELIRLATKAPTSFNLQNWRFIAAYTPAAKMRLRKIGWNQAKITDAAVTFIVVGQMTDYEKTMERIQPTIEAGIMPERIGADWVAGAKSLYHEQPWRQRDEAIRAATLGASTLMFAAQAMGLSSAPMSGFDYDAVISEFGLTDTELPVMLLAVGHATENNWPQKARRPVADVLNVI